ncbi:MAG TPA: UxaA family hydrolase, partial [Thermomicrobiales bacterium]|nr:UxaA family hydrolase [Thermomicrobiales bacterium]
MSSPSSSPLLSRAQRGSVRLADVAVLLNPNDDVVIAKQPLLPRTRLQSEDAEIVIAQMIPPGHKVAIHAVAEGDPVRRYGQIIGFATQPIAPGQHVHSHNIEVHQGELKLDY